MRRELSNIGQNKEPESIGIKDSNARFNDFVLEKAIFSSIFEKDIKRVFMYKKAERLAKALYLIAPAFVESVQLHTKISMLAIALVDAAILPPGLARSKLSEVLLTLSSVLGIARTSGLLSSMNIDLVLREVHFLLQEVAAYEEPRLSLDSAPTLSDIAKNVSRQEASLTERQNYSTPAKTIAKTETLNKGHIKDNKVTSETKTNERTEAILSSLRNKKNASIKDISHLIRGVSEKTIQRELATLVERGVVLRQGERRWSTYSLA